MINNSDFCTGILVGVVTAGIVGFVLQRILFLVARAQESSKPQTVVHKTAKTPNQVVAGSLGAGCVLFLLVIVVIGICYFSLVVVQ